MAKKLNWFSKKINKIKSAIKKLITIEPKSTKEILGILKTSTNNKIITEECYNMINGVLEVSKMQARDIMIPRSQMVVIEKDSDLESTLPNIIDSGHSRFPVIGENRDEIIGIILAKDILPYIQKQSSEINLKHLLREAMVIPESKRLNSLLKEFRVKRQHMAIIADEYGGISGLVTIEDILEQIVGEIEDETDVEEENNIIKLKKNTYHIQALTTIEEFNEYFKTNFSDEEFDTIGGLVLNSFGYLPKKNDNTSIKNNSSEFKVKVLNADNRRIKLLKIVESNNNQNNNTDNKNNNNSDKSHKSDSDHKETSEDNTK